MDRIHLLDAVRMARRIRKELSPEVHSTFAGVLEKRGSLVHRDSEHLWEISQFLKKEIEMLRANGTYGGQWEQGLTRLRDRINSHLVDCEWKRPKCTS